MSRELLNQAAKQLQRWHSFYGEHCNKINMENALPPAGDVVLLEEIETYLAQPEPEPVAWMVENHPANDTFVNFTPNFNSHFEKLGCKVTPLYTTPLNQSARIAELEKDNNITHENLAWYMEKYHEHLTIIAEAAHGLGINHE